MLQIKIIQNSISYKKLTACFGLSLPRVDVGVPKINMFEIFLCTEMGK